MIYVFDLRLGAQAQTQQFAKGILGQTGLFEKGGTGRAGLGADRLRAFIEVRAALRDAADFLVLPRELVAFQGQALERPVAFDHLLDDLLGIGHDQRGGRAPRGFPPAEEGRLGDAGLGGDFAAALARQRELFDLRQQAFLPLLGFGQTSIGFSHGGDGVRVGWGPCGRSSKLYENNNDLYTNKYGREPFQGQAAGNYLRESPGFREVPCLDAMRRKLPG